MQGIRILQTVLTDFCLNLILRTIIRLNGAPVHHIVGMLYVLRVIFIVRWSVHVECNFVSVAYHKHILLVHA